jgi:hypothetical protein
MYGYSIHYVLHEILYVEALALYWYGLEYDTDKAIEQSIENAITLYGIPKGMQEHEETAFERVSRIIAMRQYVYQPQNLNLRPELRKNARTDETSGN